MNEKNSILLLLSFFRYNWMKFVYIWNYTHISTWSLFANHTVRCFFHNFCFLLFSFLFLSFKNIVFKSHIERSHHSIQFFFSLKFPTHFPISFSIDSKSLLRKKKPRRVKNISLKSNKQIWKKRYNDDSLNCLQKPSSPSSSFSSPSRFALIWILFFLHRFEWRRRIRKKKWGKNDEYRRLLHSKLRKKTNNG